MPTGVPITVQVFAVALVGVILGWKRGVLAVLVYILIGAVGVPVFANFKGGLSVLTGLTGGYIIAWPVMTILCGIQPKTQNAKLNMTVNIILSLVGLAVCEGVGALQWALLSGNDLRGIIIYSLTAFVPKDIVLTVLAVIIGRQVRKMAAKAGESVEIKTRKIRNREHFGGHDFFVVKNILFCLLYSASTAIDKNY